MDSHSFLSYSESLRQNYVKSTKLQASKYENECYISVIFANDKIPHSSFLPSVKLSGGNVMIRVFFTVSWPTELAIIDWAVNSGLYNQIVWKRGQLISL